MLDLLRALIEREWSVIEIILIWSFAYFAGKALGTAYTHLIHSL